MKKAILYVPMIAVLVFLDQLIKLWVVNNKAALLAGESIGLHIPGILGMTYAENRGAAFGLLQNGRWFFLVVTVVALALCVAAFVKRLFPNVLTELLACVLVAGTLGNMIDRLAQGYVVDYLQFLFVDFAIFNLADTLLVCGGIALMVYFLFFYKDPPKKPEPITDEPSDIENPDSHE